MPINTRISTASCFIVLAVLLSAGCVTNRAEDRRERAAFGNDIKNIQSDVQSLGARLDQIEADCGSLGREMRGMAEAKAGSADTIERRVSLLETQLRALDAAREADKKEVIDKLSRKIAEIMNMHPAGEAQPVKPAPPAVSAQTEAVPGSAPSGDSQTYHTVKDRESLSAIAGQYGVTVDAIVKANRLKDANVIRAGQRLVIPR